MSFRQALIHPFGCAAGIFSQNQNVGVDCSTAEAEGETHGLEPNHLDPLALASHSIALAIGEFKCAARDTRWATDISRNSHAWGRAFFRIQLLFHHMPVRTC